MPSRLFVGGPYDGMRFSMEGLKIAMPIGNEFDNPGMVEKVIYRRVRLTTGEMRYIEEDRVKALMRISNNSGYDPAVWGTFLDPDSWQEEDDEAEG